MTGKHSTGRPIPDLPDVGPVERFNHGIRKSLQCDVSIPDDPGMTGFLWPETFVPYAAAAAVKMLAFLDAEAAAVAAADTNDDQPGCDHFDCACPAFVLDQRVSSKEWGNYVHDNHLDAHRARNGEETNR